MVAEATTEETRYWAYIAYAPQDTSRAAWLLRQLETLRVPKSIAGQETRFGTVPKRLNPVFLDSEELPLASVDGDQIAWALRQSRTLIVICSPSAVASGEVGRQIRDFKAYGREDRVICLLTGSKRTPVEAIVPKVARFQMDASGNLTDRPAASLVIDMRRGGDSRRLALLRMVAQITGVDLEELRHRDRERSAHRRQWFSVGALMLVALWTVLTLQLLIEMERADDNFMYAEREREASVLAQRNGRKSREMAIAAEKEALRAKDKAEATMQRLKEELDRLKSKASPVDADKR